MRVKTAELTGVALDCAAAKAEGFTDLDIWHTGAVTTRQPNGLTVSHRYSTDWSQGGPIIEREGIGFYKANATRWWAHPYGGEYTQEGPAALIAAMRCYVASKLGDEVDVPEELLC